MCVDVPARVLTNTRLSDQYNVLALGAADVARIAQPGQFVMVKPREGLDPILRRPFSIFEVVRSDRGELLGVSILNKRVGRGTSLLYDAEPGDRIDCLGPLGRPFVPVNAPAQAWMIAGGVGLAPFVTLAESLSDIGTPMTLFYGGRSAADLYYAEFFERRGARLVLTTEDGSRGERGRVTAPLGRELAATPGASPLTMYVCGPTPMMRAVADLGASHGRSTFVSLEPVMGCGMGGCYSCVVPVTSPGSSAGHFVRSCIEGPVFDASTLVWDRLSGGH